MKPFILYMTCFLCLAMFSAARRMKPIHANIRESKACRLLSKTYHSSKLEQMWIDNAGRWSNNYCSRVEAFAKEAKQWLDAIALENNNKSSVFNRNIFSSFVSDYDCSGKTVQKRTWIEPLSHGLRHPHALCEGGAITKRLVDEYLLDRDYLLLASPNDFRGPTKQHKLRGPCSKRRCQSIYIDLGASTWDTGIGGPSQSWFYGAYKDRGIVFDRLLLWEARPTPVPEIFSGLPKEVWHKYQYFNWPASANTSDVSSPLNILKEIAQPNDFVALKLDIDTPEVEMPIIRELLNNPELLELVDEFFFEYHVAFTPMNKQWFGSENPSPLPTSDTLADAYKIFYSLREKGVRAHSWV